MELLKSIACIGILGLGYVVLRSITGIYLGEILLAKLFKAFGKSTDWLKHASYEQTVKNKLKFSRANKAQRQKDKVYQYYVFVEDILISLHLKEHRITVEGFSIVCGFICALMSAGVFAMIRNLFLTAVIFCVLYGGVLALMYLNSRLGAMDRKRHTLASIDLLCANMSSGIVAAVEDNINLIHPSIRPVYKKFLRRVTALNVSVEEALAMLNEELGSSMDSFCDTVLLFEKERTPGMEVLFSFIVADNARETLRDVKIRRNTDKVIMDFVASILVLVCMLGFSIVSYPFCRDLYTTTLGSLLLIFYVVSGLLSFIATQVVIGRPYVYKEK